MNHVGGLVGVREQQPGEPEDALSVGPVKGVERRRDAGIRVHPEF